MTAASRFGYTGDPGLESAILAALHRVIDPEMSLDIATRDRRGGHPPAVEAMR